MLFRSLAHNGGSYNGSTANFNFYYKYQQSELGYFTTADCSVAFDATALKATRTGYLFEGYFDGSTSFIDADGNITSHFYDFLNGKTVTAKWQAKTYNISLNANTGISDTSTTTSVVATYDSNELIPNVIVLPTKVGYIFGGWTKTLNGDDFVISSDGNLIGTTDYVATVNGNVVWHNDRDRKSVV